MDVKNNNMARNEKAEFAVKILLEYAKENGINGRDTTDLSPLEQWLILRLYNVVGQRFIMNWINIKSKLPDENKSVLVIDDENYIWIMEYNACDGWHCPQEGWSMNVTHWMELPLPPNVA